MKGGGRVVADDSTQDRNDLLGRLFRRLAGNSRRVSPPASSDHKTIDEDRSRAVAPEVRASVHEDGLALLHIPTGRMFLCNRTGSRIWQGVVKGLSTDAICEEISRECGVARDLVEQHTSSFLAELERRGLVTGGIEVNR